MEGFWVTCAGAGAEKNRPTARIHLAKRGKCYWQRLPALLLFIRK